MADATDPDERCDFCRLPFPEEPVTTERDGVEYRFCCAHCRDAMADSDRVFTEYRGYRRFDPGVAALDAQLPQGMPRNAFVLLGGQAGSRDEALHAELVWRTLQRGEPAVIVSLQHPPISVVENFLTLDWNVLPYLEDDRLHVVDAFTYRLDDPNRLYDRMNDWNHHLKAVVDGATTAVRDASDVRELDNKIDASLDAHGMVDRGVVLIDSLTELGSLVQPVQAYNFVKDLRADVCKGRFVPVFAGATFAGDGEAFPHDLDYTADGVVDMQLNDSIVEDTLIKRIRIRKMDGVLAIPEWTAYEYTAGQGMVTFDPEAQIEKARREAGIEKKRTERIEGEAGEDESATDADEGTSGDGTPDANGDASGKSEGEGEPRADESGTGDGATAEESGEGPGDDPGD